MARPQVWDRLDLEWDHHPAWVHLVQVWDRLQAWPEDQVWVHHQE